MNRIHKSDKLAKAYETVTVAFKRDGSAGTLAITSEHPGEVSQGAITQATFDALVNGTNDLRYESLSISSDTFDIDKMDATAQGVDAVGFILDMGGEVDKVACMKSEWFSADATRTEAARELSSDAALAASTLATGIEATPAGNIAGRLVLTGLDAETTDDDFIFVTLFIKWK